MRLRRCASLMFEPREAVTLDLRALLAGHAEMASQISWVALAAHLDQPLPVDAEERQLLGELSAHRWSEPPADASPAMLARLVEQGLLLTDPPSEVGHQLRDEALRRSQWWPLAALAHRHARWQAVDSVEDMRRQGLDTAAGLRQRLGPPPPVVQPMQGDYQPLPRSEEAAFDALLARRTTCRNFDPQRALPLPLLAQVLQRTLMAHAVQKVERDTEFLKKNVPSGGGLHPTEGFLLVQNVEGLAPGLYHYHPVQHAVLPLPSPPPQALPALARRMLSGQAWFADAPALLVEVPQPRQGAPCGDAGCRSHLAAAVPVRDRARPGRLRHRSHQRCRCRSCLRLRWHRPERDGHLRPGLAQCHTGHGRIRSRWSGDGGRRPLSDRRPGVHAASKSTSTAPSLTWSPALAR